MDALLFVLGLLIVLGTVTSVLFTLVLPRQPAGIQRFEQHPIRFGGVEIQLALIANNFSR